MEANPLDMRNRIDCLNQWYETFVNQCQRIASAKDHFFDRWIVGDFGDRRFPLRLRMGCLFVGEVATKAVAAIDCANRIRDQQNPALVFLQQAFRASRLVFCQRIGREARWAFVLLS